MYFCGYKKQTKIKGYQMFKPILRWFWDHR